MRLLAATILVSVASFIAAAGCGDQSTPDIAATVDGHNIPQRLVLGWARFGASVREELGLRPQSPEVLKAAAVESLIGAQWIRAEATSLDVVLDSDDRPAAVTALEERLGLSNKQILELRRVARLGKPAFEARAVAVALEEAIVARSARLRRSLSPTTLRSYYRSHGFGEPERRTFNFFVAATKDNAMSGKLALERGERWKPVAKRYSHTLVLTRFGWRMADKSQSEVSGILGPGRANAAFAAHKYQIVGPRPFQDGWIVFEVVDVVPRGRPAFSVVREAIRNRLIDRQRNSALVSLKQKLKAKYAGQTRCAAKFGLSWCRSLRSESEPGT